jgi:hypothetical protein
MFVFDGGRFDDVHSATLPADELLSARFVPPDALGDFVPRSMVSRLLAAINALEDGVPRYLER